MWQLGGGGGIGQGWPMYKRAFKGQIKFKQIKSDTTKKKKGRKGIEREKKTPGPPR